MAGLSIGGTVLGVTSSGLRRAAGLVRVGWLTLRVAGSREFLRQLGHQVWGRTVFLGVVTDLEKQVTARRRDLCVVRFAQPEEVDQFFEKMREESAHSRYQLLVRRWFYESGFRRVIIAWTVDTNEMCCIRWLVDADDIRRAGFGGRLVPLKEGEMTLENAYTLERFRGRGIQTESALQSRELGRKLGFKRSVGQIADDNIPSLRSNKARGGMVFCRILERHLLFRVRRETIERFDPPAPISIPGEDPPLSAGAPPAGAEERLQTGPLT